MAATIVVGYDAAPAAQRALDRAIDEAKEREASLVIVAVAEFFLDPVGPEFGGLTGAAAVPPVDETLARQMLAAAKARVEPTGVTAEYEWEIGDPASAIVRVARERNAELVVLGHHHHRWLGRVLGMDVSANVEHELGAKTLVVE